jgi:hypothetical protein
MGQLAAEWQGRGCSSAAGNDLAFAFRSISKTNKTVDQRGPAFGILCKTKRQHQNASFHNSLRNEWAQIRNVVAINNDALEPVRTRDEQFMRRMANFGSARAIELAAIDMIRGGNREDAIFLLSAAIEYNIKRYPSRRLYDLFAILLARSKRLPELDDFAQRVHDDAASYVDRRTREYLLGRVSHWKGKQPKWRKVWSDPESMVKWRWSDYDGKKVDIEIKVA